MADTKARIVLSATDDTRAAFESAKRNLEGLKERAASIAGAVAPLAPAVAAAFAVEKFRGAVDVLDKLDDLAEKSGIAVKELSALRFAGEAVGTPLEALATGTRKLATHMADAAGGSKEALAAFDAIGVKVKDASGNLRSMDAVLLDVADKFAVYADGAGKSALATALFGKSGTDMIPLLNQGSGGIKRLRTEAEQLGAVYGADLAAKGAQLNDNLKKLALASEAAAVALGGPLITKLVGLTDKIIEAKKQGTLWLDVLKAIVSFNPTRALAEEGMGLFGTEFEQQDKQLADLKSKIDGYNAALEKNPGDEARKARLKQLEAEYILLSRTIVQNKAANQAGFADDALSRRAARGELNPKPDAPPEKKNVARAAQEGLFVGPPVPDFLLAANKAFDENVLTRARKFQETYDEITRQFFDGTRSWEQYDAALAELNKTTSTAGKVSSEFEDAQKSLNDMIENSSLGKLDKLQKKMQLLADAFLNGRFGAKESEEAIKTFGIIANDTLGNVAPEAEKAKSAVERIGEAFEASFTSAIISGRGLKGVLEQLEAQALAFGVSQIGKELFASATPFLSAAIGGIFGGGRAIGGPVTAGTPYIVGERGPEWFVPSNSGSIVPAGAGATVQLVDQRTVIVGDIASKADVATMLQRSNRAQVAAIQRSMNRGGALA